MGSRSLGFPQHLRRRPGRNDARGRRLTPRRTGSPHPCGSVLQQFTKDNDPHGEHDFGAIDLEGERYFFKLDYYTPDLSASSDDPADPEKTARVLTIMRADEY